MPSPALAQCLEQESRLTEQLLGVLRQEESALLGNEIDSLQSSTQSKGRLVAEFFSARQRRLACLAQQGLPAEDSSMALWLQRHGDAGVQSQWDELLRQLALAKELNRTNGLLIHQLSARNQSSLQALQSPGSAKLYGPNGHSAQRSTFTVLG